ncbi:MAG: cell division protein SepF [Acidimicrobiales bacterium]|jgi:cell division inhibitor SepF|nr:cell division protein SepF [Acidimicrobiales bacterium]
MKKLMLWLGLGPDDAYEDLSDEPLLRGPLSSTEFAEARLAAETGGTVRPLHTRVPVSNTVRTLPPESSGTVRPLQPAVTAKAHTVIPSGFEDVQGIADRFKGKQPVIVNLQGVDGDLSRRIIDFASGVCYDGDGQMEKIGPQVYLLTPSDVEVSVEDRRHLDG